MFGDGTEDCLKVDAIRCRSNTLVHNTFPLPVASIIDEPVPYDPSDATYTRDRHDCADVYYMGTGAPLDDPCEALPYAGPNWYWHENAYAILGHGRSKNGRIGQDNILWSFRANNHEQPNALAKPYAEIEGIVSAAMKGADEPQNVFMRYAAIH